MGLRQSALLPSPLSDIPAGVLEAIMDFLVDGAQDDSTLSPDQQLQRVCRRWFSTAICRPGTYRTLVEAWHAHAIDQLDMQLARLTEPPSAPFGDEPPPGDVNEPWAGWPVGNVAVGLKHAEEELRLTELSVSSDAGATVKLLLFARRLNGLLRWTIANGAGLALGRPDRQRFLRQEAHELRQRAALLLKVARDLRHRLPDPDLPMRWARWFEEAGAFVGLPRDHCARYRLQREKVAAFWASNRRLFIGTDENVEALVQSLDDLGEVAFDSDGDAPSRVPAACSTARPCQDQSSQNACGSGVSGEATFDSCLPPLRVLGAAFTRCCWGPRRIDVQHHQQDSPNMAQGTTAQQLGSSLD